MKLPSDSTQGRHVVHTTQQLLPQASHRTFPRRQQKGGVCSARLPPKLQRRPAQRVCKSNTSKVQSSTPHTLLDGRAESTRAATLSRARPPQSFTCSTSILPQHRRRWQTNQSPELVKNLVDLRPLQGKLAALSGCLH